MQSPTPFQFEGRNVRLVEQDGETWFIATDIARELGYRDAANLLAGIDADEKGTYRASTLGGDQTVSIISEAGVYRAIVQRKLNKKHHDRSLVEKIARFQRFVFHDVLPSIRATGSYNPEPAFSIPATYAEALRLAADQSERLAQQEAQIATLAPKGDFFDRFVEANGLYGYQNAGRALHCRPNLFTRWLRAKYCFDTAGALIPYQQYLQSGLFEVKNSIGDDGKARPRGFITPKGLEYFSSRIPDNIKCRDTAAGSKVKALEQYEHAGVPASVARAVASSSEAA